MLLNSFAFEKADEVSPEKFAYVWNAIEELEGYIWKQVKLKDFVPETKQLIFFHAISHYNESEGDIKPYLKKLAKTIHKTTVGPEILVSFEDGNMVYSLGGSETGTPTDANLITKAPNKVTPDFSGSVIEKLYMKDELTEALYSLVLNHLEDFVVLCKALKYASTEKLSFNDDFQLKCIELSHQYHDAFNKACLELYEGYQQVFDIFTTDTAHMKIVDINDIEGIWRESDYNYISKHMSKRVLFYNKKSNQLVQDPDSEKFYVIGAKNLGATKRIFKVDFFKAWLYLCDKIDSDQTNELKLILGNQFVVKTLGGSISMINPALYNVYELIKSEFITNILYETSGRLISQGTKTAYVLVDTSIQTLFKHNMSKMKQEKNIWVNHKNICGVEFDLIFEDVTNKLDCR